MRTHEKLKRLEIGQDLNGQLELLTDLQDEAWREANGIPSDELEEMLEMVRENIRSVKDQKQDVYNYYGIEIDETRIQIDGLEAHIKQKQELLKEYKNREMYLEMGAKTAMEMFGDKSVETVSNKFTIRKSERVIIADETLLPEQYFKSKLVVSVDKTAIKTAIKNGRNIAWASIESFSNLTVK